MHRFLTASLVVLSFEATAWAQTHWLPVELGTYDIIMVVDHDLATDEQVYDAYGMALHLAGRGIVVDWWLARDKAYEGVDFTARTDDAPDPSTDEADGEVASRDYIAGPFVIRDPDPSTDINEAWDVIFELEVERGYAPLFHEIREISEEPRLNTGFLTFMPRIAYSDNAGIARTEVDLARLPVTEVYAPGEVGANATVAGGGLFVERAGDPCGREPAFDVFLQDHYEWNGDDAEEAAAMAEFDAFLRAGTTCIFECLSATVDNTLHWLTEAGNVAVEGDRTAGFYTVEPDFADHPFAQTMGEIAEEGGAFPLWDALDNAFLPSAEHIFYDTESGDFGYMLGQVEGGKFFFAGGHRRSDLSNRRLILNAILYEVVSPQIVHEVLPPTVPAGESARREVRLIMRGGSVATETTVVDALGAGVIYVPGSAVLSVDGGVATWDAASSSLTLDVGDVDPAQLPDGLLASYLVDVDIEEPGSAILLSSTMTYDDPWTSGITFSGAVCQSIVVAPALSIEQSADRDSLLVGDNDVSLTILVENTGSDVIEDVVVTDLFPAGVSYVGPVDTGGRGAVDYDVTSPATLTWRVGWLVPGERVAATFDVVATPTVEGDFLVNDGPVATGTSHSGDALSTTAADLTLLAVLSGDSASMVFDLTPRVVAPLSPTTMTLEVTNVGRDADHLEGDVVSLTIPAGWSRPESVAPPVGWTWFYDGIHRTLSFMHPGEHLRWGVDQTFAFSFDSVTPEGVRVDTFEARTTIGSRFRARFEATLPVTVTDREGSDRDGDGLPDDVELVLRTDPDDPDSDADGLPDGYEVGPEVDAPRNTDGDDEIDALDTDSDDDGFEDAVEGISDPDGDGVPSYRDDDSDGDGLSDADEHTAGSDPLDQDSDDDGVADGDEPGALVDTDSDGLLGVLDPDSDGDGIMDGTEMGITEPLGDTDIDAGAFVPDADPSTTTDPLDADSDGGGLSDGMEDLDQDGAYEPDAGETDPLDPSDDGVVTDGDADGDSDADGDADVDSDADSDGDSGGGGDEGCGCRAVGLAGWIPEARGVVQLFLRL